MGNIHLPIDQILDYRFIYTDSRLPNITIIYHFMHEYQYALPYMRFPLLAIPNSQPND